MPNPLGSPLHQRSNTHLFALGIFRAKNQARSQQGLGFWHWVDQICYDP